jgi:hypothetical protein
MYFSKSRRNNKKPHFEKKINCKKKFYKELLFRKVSDHGLIDLMKSFGRRLPDSNNDMIKRKMEIAHLYKRLIVKLFDVGVA